MKLLEDIKKLLKLGKEEIQAEKVSSNNSKRKLTLEEKLARMSEQQRAMYYYEQSQKSDKSVLQIAIDLENTRQSKYIAHFEFSPKKQNFMNCRSLLQFQEKRNLVQYRLWKQIRDYHEKKAGGVCIKCGGDGKDMGFGHSTEAHEVWEYKEVFLSEKKTLINGDNMYDLKKNTKHRVQILKEIQSLCPMCHGIKHINRYFKDKDKTQILREAYKLFNDVDDEQLEKDLAFAHDKQKMLDNNYLLDISALLNFGYDDELKQILENEMLVNCWFNPHHESFKGFLEKEFISSGKTDEG